MGGTTFKVSVIKDGVIERDYKPVFSAPSYSFAEDLGRIDRRRRGQHRLGG